MGNERLRTAMAKARVDVEAVSSKTGVDPKTVQRWLGGPRPACATPLGRLGAA